MFLKVEWSHRDGRDSGCRCSSVHFSIVLLALLWSIFNHSPYLLSSLLHFLLLSPSLYSVLPSPPSSLRVGWSPFCCPSCVWSWSSTPAGAGVNAVASLSPRRAPVRRRLMRSTTSPQCWWEDRPVRACGTRAVKAPTPVVPWAFGRHPSWTGT